MSSDISCDATDILDAVNAPDDTPLTIPKGTLCVCAAAILINAAISLAHRRHVRKTLTDARAEATKLSEHIKNLKYNIERRGPNVDEYPVELVVAEMVMVQKNEKVKTLEALRPSFAIDAAYTASFGVLGVIGAVAPSGYTDACITLATGTLLAARMCGAFRLRD